MEGLGNDCSTSLDAPAQHNLCRCLAVFGGNACEYGGVKDSAASFAEGSLGFKPDIVLVRPLFQGFLLVEDAGFHLVDGRFEPGEGDKVRHAVSAENGRTGFRT